MPRGAGAAARGGAGGAGSAAAGRLGCSPTNQNVWAHSPPRSRRAARGTRPRRGPPPRAAPPARPRRPAPGSARVGVVDEASLGSGAMSSADLSRGHACCGHTMHYSCFKSAAGGRRAYCLGLLCTGRSASAFGRPPPPHEQTRGPAPAPRGAPAGGRAVGRGRGGDSYPGEGIASIERRELSAAAASTRLGCRGGARDEEVEGALGAPGRAQRGSVRARARR